MKNLTSEQVTQIRQLINSQDKFDAVIAFGYGPVQAGLTPNSYKLNLYGKINALATGMLYQSCNLGKIIPTGGKTGGSDKPSEAKLLATLIQAKFDIPQSVFILEEEAWDTIFNVVHIANILDSFPGLYKNLLFVALGCHLSRIQEICALVGLTGYFVAAESVVKIRSKRHQKLLLQLLNLENASYADLVFSQERGLRGIREIPEYWLPPMGSLKNPQRLRKILESNYLGDIQIDFEAESIDDLRTKISSIPRKFP
jgi:uncharacterized SAM-binding protein YcdF (DUF218 family)